MAAEPKTSRRGSTFTVDDYPCPRCGNYDVLGYLLIAEDGAHQHTRYVCTRWNHGGEWCGWEGWVVPERAADEKEFNCSICMTPVRCKVVDGMMELAPFDGWEGPPLVCPTCVRLGLSKASRDD